MVWDPTRVNCDRFGIDKEAIAKELRFAGLMMNSLNGVGSRDVGYIASDIL